MSRLPHWRFLTALVGVFAFVSLLPAAPVPTGKTPLSQVPEKAPLVVYLHGVERTRERSVTMLKASLPDLAPLVETQLDEFLKNGIEGHKLDGLEKDGPVFLTLLEMPQNLMKPPKAALIVAVKDYAKFRDGLLDAEQKKALKKDANGVEAAPLPFGEEKMYFLERKGWAVVAADKDAIETFTKDFKGLDNLISKPQAAKLLDSDLGIYLSMDQLNKGYAEQIKTAKAAVTDQLLPQVEATGKLDKMTMKLYKTMIESVFQAVEDSQGALLTIEFRPTGLALHMQTEVRPNSTTSKNLKLFQTSPFADLGRLPSGLAYYTAIKPTPDLLKSMGPLVFSVQGDAKEEESKAIKAALEKIAQAGPVEDLNSVAVPIAGLQAIKYKEAAKGLEGNLDLLRALGPNSVIQGTVVKDKPTIKSKAQQYRNIEFHAVEVPLDLEKTIEKAGFKDAPEELQKSMLAYFKKMYGETQHTWLGLDGNVVVQVTAPDWKSAQKMLDAYSTGKGTLAEDKAFKAVRQELPAATTFYAAMDPLLYGTFMAEGFRIGFEGGAQGLMKLPPNFPAKPVKQGPSYLGFATTLTPERASVDAFLSARAINESYKAFVTPFFNR